MLLDPSRTKSSTVTADQRRAEDDFCEATFKISPITKCNKQGNIDPYNNYDDKINIKTVIKCNLKCRRL